MAHEAATFDNVATAAEDVSLLAFTSGTTGDPKATMHFHRDVLAMADTVAPTSAEDARRMISMSAARRSASRSVSARCWCFPLRFRATAGLVESPTPDALLERGADPGARRACLLRRPRIARCWRSRGNYDLSSLRQCVSAGEPLPKATSDSLVRADGHSHHRRHRRDRDDPYLHLRGGRRDPSRRDRQAAARLSRVHSR